MDNAILSVIRHIIDTYGDGVFDSMPRTNAVLLDLAPDMIRERVLIRSFIEINGYRTLKNAGSEYPLIARKLKQTLTDVYCLERTAAVWVTRLFSAVLGYESEEMTDVSGAYEKTDECVTTADVNSFVAIGKAHTVAVTADSCVFAHGANEYFQCDVGSWRDIVAVAAGDNHTIGLKINGTVLAAGRNQFDQCDIGHVHDVASIYAFANDTVFVNTDGTASAVGFSALDVSHFTDIKTVARFPEGVFGIRRDGTVDVAYGTDGEAADEEAAWARTLTDVRQIISTYVMGSIVLKNDGRIYKMNYPDNYFAQWRDIVSIVDLSDYFAVLRADGSVRILPYDRDQPRKNTEADTWRDITAIYGKYKRLIGLTKDGGLRVVCTDNDWIKRNGSLDYVKDWYPVGFVP